MPDFLERAQRMPGKPGVMEDCIAFIREAVGGDQSPARGGPTSPQHDRDLLLHEVERLTNTISNGRLVGGLSDSWGKVLANLKKSL
jgi:hypothetical protein